MKGIPDGSDVELYRQLHEGEEQAYRELRIMSEAAWRELKDSSREGMEALKLLMNAPQPKVQSVD